MDEVIKNAASSLNLIIYLVKEYFVTSIKNAQEPEVEVS